MKERFFYLFVGTWLIYLAFLPPGIYSVDGYSMLAVADSIVARHDFTVPSDLGVTGKDGQTYSSWYPLQSVLAVPVVAVARTASTRLHLSVHYVESLSVTILPALYTAATVGLVYLLALALGASGIGAWLAAISYGFGTIALVYTRDFYADPLLALLVAYALLVTFTQKASWRIALITALAVLAKPTGIILGPALSLYLLWRERRFLVSVLPSLGSAIGLATYFLYNQYRFGNFRTFGQPWKFALSHIPAGLAGLSVSPGGGLLWFCPSVVLSFFVLARAKARRAELWTIVLLLGTSMLVHSFWHAWNGGWSWGPRLLLPVLPGLVAMTALLDKQGLKVLAVVTLCSFLLAAPNLFSFYARYYAEATEQQVSESALMWNPVKSPLVHAWPAALRQIRDARQSDVRELASQRKEEPATSISGSRALRTVSVWWWVLPVVHVSRIWGAVASGVLVACGVRLLALAKRSDGDSGALENATPA